MAVPKEDPVAALVWSRERPAPRRQAMTVERVVEAALRIADGDGLEAVTMRRIAADLGSGTTSVYRYVASRDDLLDLMVDAVQGTQAPPDLTGDWRADLTGIARRLRAVLLRHPWISTVMSGRPALGPNALRRINDALAAVDALTPDITVGSNVIAVLTNYVSGSVSAELAEQEAQRRTGLTQDQWRHSVGPYIRDVIAGGEYPYFARRVIDAEDPDPDQQFEFGLGCLLDGITAQVPRRDQES